MHSWWASDNYIYKKTFKKKSYRPLTWAAVYFVEKIGEKQWNMKNQKGKDLFFFYGCHFQSESSLNTEALFIDSFRPVKPWTAQLNTEDGCYCLLWFRFIRASKSCWSSVSFRAAWVFLGIVPPLEICMKHICTYIKKYSSAYSCSINMSVLMYKGTYLT